MSALVFFIVGAVAAAVGAALGLRHAMQEFERDLNERLKEANDDFRRRRGW